MRVTEGASGVPVHSRVTPHAPAPCFRTRRRGARRIGMSFSRPTFSSCCANGGGPHARRDGCIPVSLGCSPATAGSILVRASSIGSFAWQRGVPALPNVSAFTHCGAALPRICWSRRPISGSSGAAPAQAGVLLGHKKLDTTALYTRVTISALGQVTSPLDFLLKMPG
jgi:hypothetical protein